MRGYEFWDGVDQAHLGMTKVDNGCTYCLYGPETFRRIRAAMVDTGGGQWAEVKKEANLEIYSKVAEGTLGKGLSMYKVKALFPNVVPNMMYDSLHDPDYRKTWDDNMLEGFNITQLDERNDIGYYAAKFPRFISNRDFLNQRFWMEFDNGEYMICNHTVEHKSCPLKKSCVRGVSYLTGFYIQPLRPGQSPDEKGTQFLYMSHADPKGSIPTWVNNMVSSTLIPSLIGKLDTNAQNYVKWAAQTKPKGWVAPWKTPKLSWDAKSVHDLPTPSKPPAAASSQAHAPSSGNNNSRTSSASSHQQEHQQVHKTSRSGSTASTSNVGGGGGGDVLSAAGAAAATPPAARRGAGGREKAGVAEEKEMFLEAQQKALGELSLSPVPPIQAGEDKATAHYRATMHGACNFVDRQFIQEGVVPSLAEYLSRLRGVLQGARFGLPTPNEEEE